MQLFRAVVVVALFSAWVGCSSSTTGSGASCKEFEGVYTVAGDCDIATGGCVVRQQGCSGTLQCSVGGAGLVATFDGSVLTFDAAGSSCEAVLDGSAIEGTCEKDQVECTFQALRISTEVPKSDAPVCGLSFSRGMDATCDDCAERACCKQLFACRPDTDCFNLLTCTLLNCPDRGAACIASMCSDMGGALAAQQLSTCVNDNCPAECD